ncbi:LysR family transcriptional regulator [Pigmentiphaga litoralis]|uniref:DNA-binding transcriptional LysR family regulator n=1 Tax=Pigmentiphaga litoralis TaxID=516702 RepID=A0A7Y9IW50_9BURK|nr:LysR family transcriptional regulator [Pigmentiphaga litoralis]NYE22213.1 DNA-binding transcriptional LysR family regulator [Pigmentiphaga litoralis]NYE84172.1 DNA-binding transcriptional LysR family regulator [Pigmentiphaga litoralis]
MNLTVRQLQAFVHVARLGSFTKAAQAMHLTQSALSLLIRELESVLDTRLIDRTTRSVSPTAVGLEFLASAERILDDLTHAIANVDQLVAQQKGRVVVAAPLVLSSTYLPRILAGFRKRYPGIELALRDSLPDEVLPRVKSGAADIGIGTFDDNEPDLGRILLFRESLVAVFPKDHAFAQVRMLGWKQLADVPILALPRGSVFRDLAERGCADAGISLVPAFEATYVGTLIGMVGAGLGVAIVPGYATALADAQTTAWKPLAQPVVQRDVAIVHRAGVSLSPAATAFVEFLQAAERDGGRPVNGKPRPRRLARG